MVNRTAAEILQSTSLMNVPVIRKACALKDDSAARRFTGQICALTRQHNRNAQIAPPSASRTSHRRLLPNWDLSRFGPLFFSNQSTRSLPPRVATQTHRWGKRSESLPCQPQSNSVHPYYASCSSAGRRRIFFSSGKSSVRIETLFQRNWIMRILWKKQERCCSRETMR